MLGGPKLAMKPAFEPDNLFAVPDRFNFAADVVYRITERAPSAVATIAVDAEGGVWHWCFSAGAAASVRHGAVGDGGAVKRCESGGGSPGGGRPPRFLPLRRNLARGPGFRDSRGE